MKHGTTIPSHYL